MSGKPEHRHFGASGRLGVVMLALGLVGCAGVAKEPTAADSPRSAPPGAPAQPSGAADPNRLNDQVARIAGELSELQNAVAKLIVASRQQEDQLAFLRRRLEALESQSGSRMLPSAPSGFAPSPPPPAPSPPPSSGTTLLLSATTTPAAELYRAGTAQLKAKNVDAAMLSFYDLIVTYPSDPLRESAQFLVADIYFTQKDYRAALAEFEALIAAVPRGERVPDALLKVGQCQKSLGDAGRAKRTWERVVKDYPASVAARQARVLLRN
jgi:tol-pal system protein YbgF